MAKSTCQQWELIRMVLINNLYFKDGRLFEGGGNSRVYGNCEHKLAPFSILVSFS